MTNKLRENISSRESLVFCLFGGLFVYGVVAIPYILYHLFPPVSPPEIEFEFTAPLIPNIYAFIFIFSLLAVTGINLLQRLNIKSRLLHYSLLTLLLSIGGGLLTGILETTYYFLAYEDNRISFFRLLRKSWIETILYKLSSGFCWATIFFILFASFSVVFFITNAVVLRFKKTNKFR